LLAHRYTTDPFTFKTKWSGFADPESPLRSYTWTLVEADTGAAVFPPINVGLATSGRKVGLNLVDGVRYQVEVAVQNEAGSWRQSRSSGLVVDHSVPNVRQVLDLAPLSPEELAAFEQPDFDPMEEPILMTQRERRELDLDFVTELAAVRAQWAAWDVHTGIVALEVAIGNWIGGSNVMPCVCVFG